MTINTAAKQSQLKKLCVSISLKRFLHSTNNPEVLWAKILLAAAMLMKGCLSS